ncbi:MAG: FAD-dependent oxidoreductase [Spirochaetes bacterium]|nr:FAD-dependent oxidoreductase [Spirochaetota bacterium]HPG50361.1 FAD-dependent oxidoreductase [Spirochaetota bacterium]
MVKSLAADVVIVGAGTAGSYTGWKLAQAGHSVIIVERNRRGMLGRNIGIFHMDEIRFDRYGIPVPKGSELIAYHPEGLAWPPDGNRAKRVRYAFYVMELPLFINRMQKYAEDAGARIMFETGAEAPIIHHSAVSGVRVLSGGPEDRDKLAYRDRCLRNGVGREDRASLEHGNGNRPHQGGGIPLCHIAVLGRYRRQGNGGFPERAQLLPVP